MAVDTNQLSQLAGPTHASTKQLMITNCQCLFFVLHVLPNRKTPFVCIIFLKIHIQFKKCIHGMPFVLYFLYEKVWSILIRYNELLDKKQRFDMLWNSKCYCVHIYNPTQSNMKGRLWWKCNTFLKNFVKP